jgi:hypothetical protein
MEEIKVTRFYRIEGLEKHFDYEEAEFEHDEAKGLYEALHEIFGKKEVPINPHITETDIKDLKKFMQEQGVLKKEAPITYPPYEITYTDGSPVPDPLKPPYTVTCTEPVTVTTTDEQILPGAMGVTYKKHKK